MLELKNIKKSFNGITVLDGISLNIDKGEIVSVLGSSGSGKTTLLNSLLGIIPIDDGNIILENVDITNTSIQERGFYVVFQDYALFPHLNAYKNIIYGLKNFPNVSTQEEIDKLIDILELRDHLDKNIEQLSGGQKQRVAIARTLVMKPKVLLLDEPLSALDGIIKESIKKTIKDIVAEFNLTTIIVTHDPEEALTLSDKVLILDSGHIAQYDTPQNIIDHPNCDFVKDFILQQLYIKKENILNLFEDSHA
jgi:iron(III) transport system ATP-binding protein